MVDDNNTYTLAKDTTTNRKGFSCRLSFLISELKNENSVFVSLAFRNEIAVCFSRLNNNNNNNNNNDQRNRKEKPRVNKKVRLDNRTTHAMRKIKRRNIKKRQSMCV